MSSYHLTEKEEDIWLFQEEKLSVLFACVKHKFIFILFTRASSTDQDHCIGANHAANALRASNTVIAILHGWLSQHPCHTNLAGYAPELTVDKRCLGCCPLDRSSPRSHCLCTPFQTTSRATIDMPNSATLTTLSFQNANSSFEVLDKHTVVSQCSFAAHVVDCACVDLDVNRFVPRIVMDHQFRTPTSFVTSRGVTLSARSMTAQSSSNNAAVSLSTREVIVRVSKTLTKNLSGFLQGLMRQHDRRSVGRIYAIDIKSVVLVVDRL